MFLNFIDREYELKYLDERFNSNSYELIVIYGRRRIGKTTLLEKFLKNHNGFYFLSDKAGSERNAIRLKKKVATFLDEPAIESNDFFDIIENLCRKNDSRFAVVIDEFSYLVEKDKAIPSIFQRIADRIVKRSNLMLVLCGSSISMMEMGVLSKKSPLYGRKTGHLKIQKMNLVDIHGFYPNSSLLSNVKYYSVAGGIPHYMEKFTEERTVDENIEKEIFSRSGRLYEETDFLLKQEFREPDVYKAILSAIASGCTRVVEIGDKAYIPAHNLSRYLNSLMEIGLITKNYSGLDHRKKKPRYGICDNFFNFWFTFCEPFKSDLEIMELDYVLNYFNKNFNTYLGRSFERIIRDQLLRKIIPFRIKEINQLWYGEIEIDAMVKSDSKERYAFVEIKFKENVNGRRVLEKMKSKVNELPIYNKKCDYFVIAISFSSKADGCISLEEIVDLYR